MSLRECPHPPASPHPGPHIGSGLSAPGLLGETGGVGAGRGWGVAGKRRDPSHKTAFVSPPGPSQPLTRLGSAQRRRPPAPTHSPYPTPPPVSLPTILQGSFSATMQTFSRLSAPPLLRGNLGAGERQADETAGRSRESTPLTPPDPHHTPEHPGTPTLLHLLGLFFARDAN